MIDHFLEEVAFRTGFEGWMRFRDAEVGEGRNIRKRYHRGHMYAC